MSLREELNGIAPRLRRYARALVTGGAGASDLADDLVHATVMRALGARGLGTRADLPVRLYATVTQLHRDLSVVGASAMAAAGGRPSLVSGAGVSPARAAVGKVAIGLMRLSLEEREALILVVLENFDHATAARILRIPRPVLLERLTRARTTLDEHFETRPPVETRGRRVPYLRLVN